MRKIHILLAIFIFCFVSSTMAETTIKAEVNKLKISTDDTLIYKITVASSDKNLPQPTLPKFTGFSAVSQAQSSSMSFQKSNVSTTIAYEFLFVPNDIGKFKIEPATIKISNKLLSTDSFEIEVTQGKTKPEAKPKEQPPTESLSSSEEPQITL